MVAQIYDGASAMSGKENGAPALVRKQCPYAVFVHCFSHCLNLVISGSNSINEVRSAYMPRYLIAATFFKNSARRVNSLEKCIEEMCPEA